MARVVTDQFLCHYAILVCVRFIERFFETEIYLYLLYLLQFSQQSISSLFFFKCILSLSPAQFLLLFVFSDFPVFSVSLL